MGAARVGEEDAMNIIIVVVVVLVIVVGFMPYLLCCIAEQIYQPNSNRR